MNGFGCPYSWNDAVTFGLSEEKDILILCFNRAQIEPEWIVFLNTSLLSNSKKTKKLTTPHSNTTDSNTLIAIAKFKLAQAGLSRLKAPENDICLRYFTIEVAPCSTGVDWGVK